MSVPTATWDNFNAIKPTGTPNPISNGQPILAEQIAALYDRVDLYLTWFKGNSELFPFPDKFTFTSPQYNAAFRLISTGSNPSSLSEGDVWRVGDEIRFRGANNVTKTVMFSDSSFTTVTASGNVSAGGTLTVTGATTLNSVTTINSNLDDALKVVRTSTNKTKFRVNASSNTVQIGDGTTFSVFSGDVGVGNATFSVTPAGVVTVLGALNVSTTITGPTLQTNSSNFVDGDIKISTAGIQRYNNSLAAWEFYGSPRQVHSAGITFNIGNGVDTITTGVQIPIVVIPYKCVIEGWTISQPLDSTTGTIAVDIEKRTSSNAAFSTLTGLSSTVVKLTTGSYATGTVSDVELLQGEVLRVKVASGVTLKAAGIHLRLRRTL